MEDHQKRSHSRGIGLVAILLVSAGLAVYMPLVLAGIEAALFGTRTVEEICEFLQIHDILSEIYKQTVFRFF